jgi:hypothetical protein
VRRDRDSVDGASARGGTGPAALAAAVVRAGLAAGAGGADFGRAAFGLGFGFGFEAALAGAFRRAVGRLAARFRAGDRFAAVRDARFSGRFRPVAAFDLRPARARGFLAAVRRLVRAVLVARRGAGRFRRGLAGLLRAAMRPPDGAFDQSPLTSG